MDVICNLFLQCNCYAIGGERQGGLHEDGGDDVEKAEEHLEQLYVYYTLYIRISIIYYIYVIYIYT